jgi:hypothetical protein
MELDDLGDDWAFAGINDGEVVEEDFLCLERIYECQEWHELEVRKKLTVSSAFLAR